MHRLSGNLTGFDYQSEGRSLGIQFISDFATEGPGFQAKYKQTGKARCIAKKCESAIGLFSSCNGVITS